mgnify:CR=1 FL=1
MGGTLINRTRHTPATFRLIVDTFNKAPTLIEYFDQFKPQTTKLFVRYKHIYNIWLSNAPKLNEILPEINKTIYLNKKKVQSNRY